MIGDSSLSAVVYEFPAAIFALMILVELLSIVKVLFYFRKSVLKIVLCSMQGEIPIPS